MGIIKKTGLKGKIDKTSSKVSRGIFSIFSEKKLDDEIIDELEELLISTDMSMSTVSKILTDFRKEKFSKKIEPKEVQKILANKLSEILKNSGKTLKLDKTKKPEVFLFVGVNGTGKTTTIGKIAKLLKDEGKKSLIVACDTFRAGATEQLKIWAERANSDIIHAAKEGEDPASLAFKGLEKAKAEEADVVLIDTAGRLQNKANLMEELRKIDRVLKKIDEEAPHNTILVLDATTGQNAKSQLLAFKDIVNINGLIITKLDGSAKGGILVSLVDEFFIPIFGVGVGEKVEDLREFDAKDFAKNLVGVE
ncbi:signal recognition particle-docking protein FtsY [Pseudomonadota bacterium]